MNPAEDVITLEPLAEHHDQVDERDSSTRTSSTKTSSTRFL